MPFAPSDSAPALRLSQKAFLQDLMSLRPRTAAERERIFREPLYGTVESRWHLHVNRHVGRITEALAVELPAVRRILGEPAFASLAARYLTACPPGSYDLASAGDRLPRFLESDPLTSELPFLPDLARLERRIAEASVARDGVPLTWNALQAMAPEVLAGLRLRLVPGTALISSRWPVHELVSGQSAATGLAAANRTDIVVHRQGDVVRCEAVDTAEASVLAASARGEATIAELAARAGTESFSPAFERLVRRGHFQSVPGPRPVAGRI